MGEFSYIVEQCTKCSGKGYLRPKIDGIIQNTSTECECLKKMFAFIKFKESNIPLEYFNLSIDNFIIKNEEKAKIKRVIEKISENTPEFLRNGMGLYIYGPAGTGKTMLATEIIKKAIFSGFSAHYDWFPILIDFFNRKGYEADKKKDELNNLFTSKDFLIIDELGKEINGANSFTNDDICRFLEINILKKRSNKSTILISNIPNGIDGLHSRYGEFVTSVIKQRFHVQEFSGLDHREVGNLNITEKFLGDK